MVKAVEGPADRAEMVEGRWALEVTGGLVEGTRAAGEDFLV